MDRKNYEARITSKCYNIGIFITSDDLRNTGQIEDAFSADALHAAANQSCQHCHRHNRQAKRQEEVRGFPTAWKHAGIRGEAVQVKIRAMSLLPVQPDATIENSNCRYVGLWSILW